MLYCEAPQTAHETTGWSPEKPVTAAQVDTWLREYAKTRDPALRERIVLAHMRLAERLATRFHEGPTISREDLRQTARMGLVAAVNRYDPDRGVPFISYAVACMMGELKRCLRDTAWRLHVSRRIQEFTLRLLPELDELRVSLCRSPTLTELAGRLQATEEMVSEALEAVSSRSVLSLDRLGLTDEDGSSPPLVDTLVADGPSEDIDDLLMLPEIVDRLPDVERRVIILYYFQELRQRDIGDQLGCSQMQVSRLLARALGRLRAMLLIP
jgi:RNA polymerase sigma-B factor